MSTLILKLMKEL